MGGVRVTTDPRKLAKALDVSDVFERDDGAWWTVVAVDRLDPQTVTLAPYDDRFGPKREQMNVGDLAAMLDHSQVSWLSWNGLKHPNGRPQVEVVYTATPTGVVVS